LEQQFVQQSATSSIRKTWRLRIKHL